MRYISIKVPQVILDKYNLNYKEFLYLLYKMNNNSASKIETNLLKKNIGINVKRPNKFCFTLKEKRLVNAIYADYRNFLINMRNGVQIDPKFIEYAEKMQQLYPSGTRPGCSVKWRGNKLILAKKLTSLVQDYGITFTEEQALDATRRYVESFNNDFTYMECLEYFILRERPEFKSNFISYLEDTTDANNSNDDILNLRN